jgi:hypothetical protein
MAKNKNKKIKKIEGQTLNIIKCRVEGQNWKEKSKSQNNPKQKSKSKE